MIKLDSIYICFNSFFFVLWNYSDTFYYYVPNILFILFFWIISIIQTRLDVYAELSAVYQRLLIYITKLKLFSIYYIGIVMIGSASLADRGPSIFHEKIIFLLRESNFFLPELNSLVILTLIFCIFFEVYTKDLIKIYKIRNLESTPKTLYYKYANIVYNEYGFKGFIIFLPIYWIILFPFLFVRYYGFIIFSRSFYLLSLISLLFTFLPLRAELAISLFRVLNFCFLILLVFGLVLIVIYQILMQFSLDKVLKKNRDFLVTSLKDYTYLLIILLFIMLAIYVEKTFMGLTINCIEITWEDIIENKPLPYKTTWNSLFDLFSNQPNKEIFSLDPENRILSRIDSEKLRIALKNIFVIK